MQGTKRDRRGSNNYNDWKNPPSERRDSLITPICTQNVAEREVDVRNFLGHLGHWMRVDVLTG